MLRNTFFALAVVLGMAGSSQAAILLSQSLAATQPEASSGLVAYILTATGDAGETIAGIGDPFISANNGGSGLHQVWAPFSATGSPTREAQVLGGALWNDAWIPYDSYWLFTGGANDLGTGPLTEANNKTGGATGLPAGVAGLPDTGYGNLGPDAGVSRGYTIASGLQGSSVAFAQLVMKSNESVLVDMRVTTTQGGALNATFADFCVGACDPQTGTPPVVDPLNFPNVNSFTAGLLSGTVTQTGGDPVPTWDGFTFVGYTPNYGGSGDGATVAGSAGFDEGSQLFSWNPLGAPRGDYVWQVTATNSAGSDDGLITVNVTAVPEPSTMALCGLAFVGVAGLIRRRNG